MRVTARPALSPVSLSWNPREHVCEYLYCYAIQIFTHMFKQREIISNWMAFPFRYHFTRSILGDGSHSLHVKNLISQKRNERIFEPAIYFHPSGAYCTLIPVDFQAAQVTAKPKPFFGSENSKARAWFHFRPLNKSMSIMKCQNESHNVLTIIIITKCFSQSWQFCSLAFFTICTLYYYTLQAISVWDLRP